MIKKLVTLFSTLTIVGGCNISVENPEQSLSDTSRNGATEKQQDSPPPEPPVVVAGQTYVGKTGYGFVSLPDGFVESDAAVTGVLYTLGETNLLKLNYYEPPAGRSLAVLGAKAREQAAIFYQLPLIAIPLDLTTVGAYPAVKLTVPGTVKSLVIYIFIDENDQSHYLSIDGTQGELIELTAAVETSYRLTLEEQAAV